MRDGLRGDSGAVELLRRKNGPMGLNIIPPQILGRFEVYEFRHAAAVLSQDFPNEWGELMALLSSLEIPRKWITEPGGNKSRIADWVDGFLCGARGWCEKMFETKITVDGRRFDSPTHKVDCFKNGIAFELEWNNKDPFFDRDLNNFRLLFDLRMVSVGVILTRADELQDLFDHYGKGSSYGNSTTHMSKLIPRIEGGGGGGCPLLAFGIRQSCVKE